MIKTIKSFLTAAFIVSGLLFIPLAIVASPSAAAATTLPSTDCNQRLLTFPAWYNGLAGPAGECNIISPAGLGGDENTQLSRFIWKIVLNVIDILLQAVAYAAVGFIIYGGFKYISSTGRADKVKEGRELILNAVIGLVISIFAATIVGYIGASL